MDPNTNDQSTPAPLTDVNSEVPMTESQPQMATPSMGVGNETTTPVSPLQAITEQEQEPQTEQPIVPVATPQAATLPTEKKKSKTTLYLLIVLGIVVLAAVGVFIYTMM